MDFAPSVMLYLLPGHHDRRHRDCNNYFPRLLRRSLRLRHLILLLVYQDPLRDFISLIN